MDETQDVIWDTFIGDLQNYGRSISRSSAVNVNTTVLRQEAKLLGRNYFRTVRPPILLIGMDRNIVSRLDLAIQRLIHLSTKQNAKISYINAINDAIQIAEEISVIREMNLSDQAIEESSPTKEVMSDHERLIAKALEEIVPSASRSYIQGINDLADTNRISYRGAANEFREALREILDQLAPDNEVTAQPNFQFEDRQSTPTRKQKARYILKARGMNSTALKVPEGFIEAIEEKVAAVVSATYGRSNNASHVHTERLEVQRIKQYLDVILSELLALPAP